MASRGTGNHSDRRRSRVRWLRTFRVFGISMLMASTAPVLPAASSAGQATVDRSELRREVAVARARWNANKPGSYEFVLSIPVSAPSWWSRRFASYRVTSGSSVTLAPPTGFLTAVFLGRDTIDTLFDLVTEQVDSTAGRLSVSYDAELGYPSSAFLGEVSFNVPVFRAFSRSSDVAEPFVLLEHLNHCGFVASARTDLSACPDYAIAIWGDGTVAYLGNAGVRTLGRHEHQVSRDAVQDLVRSIGATHFIDLDDDYSSMKSSGGLTTTIDHSAEQWLTIRSGGRQKTVHDFYGAPDALRLLESTIEAVTDSRRYTGRDSTLSHVAMPRQ